MLSEKTSRPVDKSRLWHRAKGEQWKMVTQTLATLEDTAYILLGPRPTGTRKNQHRDHGRNCLIAQAHRLLHHVALLRLCSPPRETLQEFLEGKVWDAGAFLLETQTSTGACPHDELQRSLTVRANCPDEHEEDAPVMQGGWDGNATAEFWHEGA